MMTKILLQKIMVWPPEDQFKSLAWVHRYLKRQLAYLNMFRLSYIERGHEEAWNHKHEVVLADILVIEQAIETRWPAPTLPDWL